MDATDSQNVVSTIHEFCRALDERDWALLRRCLAPVLATDYSSFRGTEPARMTAEEFISLRENGLATLLTQHLTCNHLVTFKPSQAGCRFDFVIHRWPKDPVDSRFLHTYGYYEMLLGREPMAPHAWVIEAITQHAIHSEGDPAIHGAHRAEHGRRPEAE